MNTKLIKKALAALLCAVMVLAMIPVVTLTASAVDVEGDWDTFRKASHYDESLEVYTPAPGYEYTEDGFKTVAPDYTDVAPYYAVRTKEKVNIKDGVHLEIRIDNFTYTGENGNCDEWISFNLWSDTLQECGNTKFGQGWYSMIRGAGNGAPATAESVISDSTARTFQGSVPVTPIMDDEGCERYTLDVIWTGEVYEIYINDVIVKSSTTKVTELLETINENGEFHVGITIQTSQMNGVADMTVTKFGTSKEDAAVPRGSDSKEPEWNNCIFVEVTDPSTVETGKPALLWDAQGISYQGDPAATNLELTAQGDNSYRIKALAEDSAYYSWEIKRSASYDAADFPVFAMLVKDFEAGVDGQLWYCSGEVLNPQNDCFTNWSLWDDDCKEYGDEDTSIYNLVIVDLSVFENWTGRINNFRVEYRELDVSEEYNTWTCQWMGMFRSVEEAQSYSDSYITSLGISLEDPTEASTETPTDAETQTEAPAETPTDAETETEAPTETPATDAETEASDDEGCASVLTLGSAVVLLSAVAAAAVLKKKD